MNLVRVIVIGGENHCVEDEGTALFHGEAPLLSEVGNLTEQCDRCGAGGPDSVYRLVHDAVPEFPYYECSDCGKEYPVRKAHPNDTVFP